MLAGYRTLLPIGVCLLMAASAVGAVVTARAVAINGVPSTPSAHVTIQPGDSVTVDFHVTGWNADVPGSGLRSYQVGLNGIESYHSGTRGRLIPLGWDAFWPTRCHTPNECPPQTPFCNGLFGTCGCINGLNSCPQAYPTCSSSLCIGPFHEPAQGAFIDTEREDFVFAGLTNVLSAVRVPQSDLNPAWGAVPLTSMEPDVPDVGQSGYAGTHIVQASIDACGSFTFTFGGQQGSFLLLRHASLPPTGVSVTPVIDTVTIEVESNEPCTTLTKYVGARILSPSLSRLRLNTIVLEFDGEITVPAGGSLTLSELTPDLCGGAIGADLSAQLDISVDAMPNRLIVQDPLATTLQTAMWYRLANTGLWSGVEPFSVDFRVLIGDANSDGLVNFADLSVIHQSIPTLRSGINESNRQRDINADGFINFADLGAVFHFLPATSAPYPCQ